MKFALESCEVAVPRLNLVSLAWHLQEAKATFACSFLDPSHAMTLNHRARMRNITNAQSNIISTTSGVYNGPAGIALWTFIPRLAYSAR